MRDISILLNDSRGDIIYNFYSCLHGRFFLYGILNGRCIAAKEPVDSKKKNNQLFKCWSLSFFRKFMGNPLCKLINLLCCIRQHRTTVKPIVQRIKIQASFNKILTINKYLKIDLCM